MVNFHGKLSHRWRHERHRWRTCAMDQLVERLHTMQAAAPDIEASAVVSVDRLDHGLGPPTGSRGGPGLGHVGSHAEPG